jgi:hypothetical protein
MMVKARVIRPPAPSPCNPRVTISWVMFCAAPASSEPTRKAPIENRNTGRRPYRSAILPYSGVEAVEASRYAVTTQE